MCADYSHVQWRIQTPQSGQPSPLLPSPFPPLSLPFPLEVGPLIEGLGSDVSSPRGGVWGGAEVEFGAF